MIFIVHLRFSHVQLMGCKKLRGRYLSQTFPDLQLDTRRGAANSPLRFNHFSPIFTIAHAAKSVADPDISLSDVSYSFAGNPPELFTAHHFHLVGHRTFDVLGVMLAYLFGKSSDPFGNTANAVRDENSHRHRIFSDVDDGGTA